MDRVEKQESRTRPEAAAETRVTRTGAASGKTANASRRRAPRKRAGRLASGGTIMEAAMKLFLRNGYQGTSMDQIAALAGVSKQTIYTHFADKGRLFHQLVERTARHAEGFARAMAVSVQTTEDVESALGEIAQRYLATVFRPQVLQLRRLVMMEAQRFPAMARSYYEEVSARTIAALSNSLHSLAARGLLSITDPTLAAKQLAALLVMIPLDRAMFVGDPDLAEVEGLARQGVRVFLAAYRSLGGRPGDPRTG